MFSEYPDWPSSLQACPLNWGIPNSSQEWNEEKGWHFIGLPPGGTHTSGWQGLPTKGVWWHFLDHFRGFYLINNIFQQLRRPNFSFCAQHQSCLLQQKTKRQRKLKKLVKITSWRKRKNKEGRADNVHDELCCMPDNITGDKDAILQSTVKIK